MHMVFLICLSSLVTWADGYPPDDGNNYDYGVMLDAGSSGTKFKLYRWHRRHSPMDKIDIKLTYSRKFKPGISELTHDLGDVAKYLTDIIADAKTLVPDGKHKLTPLYLMATAGLRTLENSVTEALMARIQQVLNNASVNPFVVPDNGVRVLSGEEEGVFAWVAANYLRGHFWSDRAPSQTVGVLEMGGGSTQIAFLPDGYIYANMFPVHLAGKTFHLYAHSYLLYGQNYIISRINTYLLALESELSEIENPCMLTGDNTTTNSLGTSVQIRGTGDVTKCLEILDIFLRTAEEGWCYPKPCAIGRTYQPEVGQTNFYAISAFIYAPDYLKAVDSLGRLNLTLLKENAIKHCSRTFEDVVSSGLSEEYASSYCTMGLYIPSLLINAYGFSENTTSVYVTSKINEVDVDWAMGAMLLEIEYMQASSFACETSGSRTFGVDFSHTMNLIYALCVSLTVSSFIIYL